MHETSAVDSKDRGTNLPKNIFCSGTTSGPLVVGLFLKPWVIYGSALGILWTYLLWIFYGSICFKPQETIPRTPTMRQTSSVVGLFLKPWIIYGSALGILCNLLWIFYGSICFKPKKPFEGLQRCDKHLVIAENPKPTRGQIGFYFGRLGTGALG